MTVAASVPTSPSHLRIAITSPDILARIRQVFASKNLDVDFVRLPYVELTVKPAASATVSTVGNALRRLAGATSPVPTPDRLCAEYRLDVVDWPRVEHPAPVVRRHLAAVAAPDADRPVVTLSRRQREVMALVSRGVRNTEIAARLRVSEKTVKNHINRIFRSLGAGSRVEAVLIWQHHQRNGVTRRGAENAPRTPVAIQRPGTP